MAERVLFDSDGNEVKVPDEAEITALQESRVKVETLQKELDEAKQAVNPNWQETRRIMKALETENANFKKLQDKGKTINEAGDVVDYSGTVTVETVTKTAEVAAQRATTQALVDQRKQDYLLELPEEQRNLVSHFFGKLSAGEEMSVAKVDEIMEAAFNAAGVGVEQRPQSRRTTGISGSGMRSDTTRKKENFAETEAGKSFASSMGLRFINASKK